MPMFVKPCLRPQDQSRLGNFWILRFGVQRCLGLADVGAAIAGLHVPIPIQERTVWYSGTMEGLRPQEASNTLESGRVIPHLMSGK